MSDQAKTVSGLAVRKTVTVECDQQHAFAVFTDGFGTWWNRSHHIGTAELDDCFIEPKAGGRWYERGVDGSECDWGHVIVWEPPGRIVLAWQLNAEWDYDPKLVTELEITFVDEGDGCTRVELEHRNLERMGAKAHEVRDAIDSESGWGGLLRGYVRVANGA
jgi:hypothetical protein